MRGEGCYAAKVRLSGRRRALPARHSDRARAGTVPDATHAFTGARIHARTIFFLDVSGV